MRDFSIRKGMVPSKALAYSCAVRCPGALTSDCRPGRPAELGDQLHTGPRSSCPRIRIGEHLHD